MADFVWLHDGLVFFVHIRVDDGLLRLQLLLLLGLQDLGGYLAEVTLVRLKLRAFQLVVEVDDMHFSAG